MPQPPADDEGPRLSPEPPGATPVPPPPASEEALPFALLAIGAAGLGWAFLLVSWLMYALGQLVAAIVLFALSIALAAAAMACGAAAPHAHHHHGHAYAGPCAGSSGAGEGGAGGACGAGAGGATGLLLGKGIASVAILVALAEGLIVVPLLLGLLLGLFACRPDCAGCSAGGSGGGGGGGGCCLDECCSAGCCATGGCCDCGCGACDCGCGACDCGCGDCGGCDCGGCACGAVAVAPGVVAGASALAGSGVAPGLLAPVTWRARWATFAGRHLAHHPDEPRYAHDCYRILGARVCIGCATTYPMFLLAATLLTPIAGALSPLAWIGLGALAASAQAVSSLGLARTRARKATVKTLLGAGLAAVLVGVLAAPWALPTKVLALLATMALAYASAIPRRLRMARAAREAKGASCARCTHAPGCAARASPHAGAR